MAQGIGLVAREAIADANRLLAGAGHQESLTGLRGTERGRVDVFGWNSRSLINGRDVAWSLRDKYFGNYPGAEPGSGAQHQFGGGYSSSS